MASADSTETEGTRALSVVDCDVHQGWADPSEVTDRLPDHYRELRGFALPGSSWTNPNGFLRDDARPDDGGRPGSDPEKLIEQHVEPFDVDYCVLTGSGILSLGVCPDARYAAAMATAYNDWLVDRWLGVDERFVGAIHVAPHAPQRAAEEIRRLGDHPRVVQVLMSSGAAVGEPYGRERYWPIYEAAVDNDLPVAIHPGTEGRGAAAPASGAGYPATYMEWHSSLPANFIGHLVSLVSEGALAEHPDLRFVCIEGGLSWVPHVLWRMDKNWRALRAEVPYLERPPSEYVREQVRFTTQPVAEPPRPEYLRQILEMMHAEETVLFSSDYPHWDNDSPEHGLPPLEESMRAAIMHGNAQELYGLPDDPADLD